MEKTIADAKACGYVSTLFGRRPCYCRELASSNFNVRSSGERMARNSPIQGTAADVIKLAMVRVWKRLRNEKMESRLILTVHDELIVEAPEAEAEKAAEILRGGNGRLRAVRGAPEHRCARWREELGCRPSSNDDRFGNRIHLRRDRRSPGGGWPASADKFLLYFRRSELLRAFCIPLRVS